MLQSKIKQKQAVAGRVATLSSNHNMAATDAKCSIHAKITAVECSVFVSKAFGYAKVCRGNIGNSRISNGINP